MAYKKIRLRRRPEGELKEEISVLKNLTHHHIVKLLGSFYQKPYLGLLIWPAATCDLSIFLESWNAYKLTTYDEDSRRYFQLPSTQIQTQENSQIQEWEFDAIGGQWLSNVIGCLTSAVAHLHQRSIRHKDIKPSNVVISHEGIWLTDFGSAKDFTDALTSSSECRDRGTLLYCAPEVARYEVSGRSADVFSLGCVLLEVAIAWSHRHESRELDGLRPAKNNSYEANLDQTKHWLALLRDDDPWQGNNTLVDFSTII